MYSFLIKQNTELKTLYLKQLPGECLTECITKKIIKISIRNLWFRLIISTKKPSSICSINYIKSYHCRKDINHPLRNKFPYSDFFLVRIYPHSNLSGDLLCKSPHSVRIWKNMDKKTLNTKTFYTEIQAELFSAESDQIFMLHCAKNEVFHQGFLKKRPSH